MQYLYGLFVYLKSPKITDDPFNDYQLYFDPSENALYIVEYSLKGTKWPKHSIYKW